MNKRKRKKREKIEDVRIGKVVKIKRNKYRCLLIKQVENSHYDCNGCDLYGKSECERVFCTGPDRKDGMTVVFKLTNNK